MLPTSAGVEPATSWSPVGRRIQLSHRGRQVAEWRWNDSHDQSPWMFSGRAGIRTCDAWICSRTSYRLCYGARNSCILHVLSFGLQGNKCYWNLNTGTLKYFQMHLSLGDTVTSLKRVTESSILVQTNLAGTQRWNNVDWRCFNVVCPLGKFSTIWALYQPQHEKMYLVACASNEDSNQPVRSDQNLCCPSREHTYIILTPLNPILYSKTGVDRGIHYFSYFCSKT